MATTTSSPHENRALCRRFVDEVFNNHDPGALGRLVTPDFQNHGLPNGLPSGRQGTETFLAGVFRGFPDVRMRVLHEYVDGDNVIVHWNCQGTHRGPFMGVDATNRRAPIDGVDIFRCENGKIAEVWSYFDALELLRQIGVFQPSMNP